MKPSNKNKPNLKQNNLTEGKKKVNKTSSKKGFSLVELICVIAIIVILGSVVAFNYIKIVRELPWEQLV
ncbi:MAG: type II secretion system GspH family protein [Saccharofermentans sp.]|nr:type II secretion system GspH family protein [Saccharofermentans sp.]